MDAVDEHDLTYHMVIELLAHQFAFPVKWTETQRSLFTTHNVERLIEVGPADTLATMAKRTLADSMYTDWDAAMSIDRKILSCKSNHDEIYHIQADEPPATKSPANTVLATAALPPPSPPATNTDSVAASAGRLAEGPDTILAAEILPDESITARQVLMFLVAYKLKRLISDLSESTTIKALVQGRSTLENEIIGDLIEEFSVVPEQAEELPLSQLASELQAAGFLSKLGKKSLSIVSKEITSKMPAGFSIQKVREHLHHRWGLPTGRQDAVLMFAAVSAPPSRFKDEASATKFLDDVYARYATEYGIKVVLASNTAITTTNSMAIDPEISLKLTKTQNQFYQGLLDACCKALSIEQSRDQAADLQKHATELQTRLDDWVVEHGEAYASGIEPMMKKEKARTYDSSWNWALVDLLRTCFDLRMGASDESNSSDLIDSIANRSDPSLQKVISFLLDRETRASRKVDQLIRFLERLSEECAKAWAKPPAFKPNFTSLKPEMTITEDGRTQTFEVPRWAPSNNLDAYIDELSTINELSGRRQPLLHLKARQYNTWSFDGGLTDIFFDEVRDLCASGLSLVGKYVLLTGAGRRSIGAEVLAGLLAAGAHVIVTTSSYSVETARYFQQLYATTGSRNSRLIVVPCNMASVRDVNSLTEWIYGDHKDGGLSWDLDYIIPFAALGEEGREIDNIDSRSELAHRVMLTNTIRLLGAVSERKRAITSQGGCRPAQVILPLSPNHGIFGGDGLYAESKLGLESLLRKWHSESWSDTLTICGCSIGWTRSTSLMKGNDLVAADVEGVLGVRTFSPEEMAFNILVLMKPSMVNLCEDEPIYADFNGGLDLITDLKLRVDQIRADIQEKKDILQAIHEEDRLEGLHQDRMTETTPPPSDQRGLMDVGFPQLSSFEDTVGDLGDKLQGMVDLDRVVVITGFGELGPYGSSRTRWEMECDGRFSLEGCIEMAWIMGLIKHHAGPLPSTTDKFFGWVDTTTGHPVADVDVKTKYEKRILEQSGIRLVEPALWNGYDPTKRQMLQEVLLEGDLPPFEASEQEAREFKREHGDRAEIFSTASGQFNVVLKKGAALLIPKALNAGSHVAGQLPTGWDPRRYGISDDIISQVDRITLFALICASEAFLSSGFTDPYELYKYVHLAEVGNCIGTGIGGATSLNKMHKGRFRDQPVQMDILQETFGNTVTAWVNMLLVSATGPIRTPVGACATGLESLDAACDLIVTGKAKVCLVGASDDMEEDEASEFANMKATVNSQSDLERGRGPEEMSRPTASSRAGFVEAQGCGIQIAMAASTALEMGVPIYAVVAYTGMASDKVSRSVPAPGKGILSTAREDRVQESSSIPLSVSSRKALLEARLRKIEELQKDMLDHEETASDSRVKLISQQMEKNARFELGNGFWHQSPGIAPLRGALAVWGLDIDDISVVSFHGTSTKMNDRNELDIVQRQMAHLRRQSGNVLLGIFQKYLTGHPKGPASSWMLNGCLQVLRTGMVPGNRNADNIDKEFKQFDFVAIPNGSIQTDGVSAFALNSFGFGQKGAQAVGVHPRYLYATLDAQRFEKYRERVEERRRKVEQQLEGSMVRHNLVMLKTDPPFGSGMSEYRNVMNPCARAEWHAESASYRFT